MRLTLREIDAHAKGVNRKRDGEFRQAVAIAHMNAGLARAKKFPKLDRILPPREKPMTPEQRHERIWGAITMLAKPGEVQRVRRKR